MNTARAAIGVTVAALLIGAASGTARAFQNPDTFLADPMQAGGGGRFFTGSPLDAYTCEVCHGPNQEARAGSKPHRAQPPASVQVFGLPEPGYQAGVTYRVTVDWPDDLLRVALTMEMTDREGRALGVWTEPDPTTLTAADRCSLLTDTPTGVRVFPLAGPRAVVSGIDCGQLQTTLNWTAPASPDPLLPLRLPDALLSGALVASNTNGGLAGDSVATFARNLAGPGAPPVAATDVRAHCSTIVRQAGTMPAWLVGVLALLVLAVQLRRAHRTVAMRCASAAPRASRRAPLRAPPRS